MTNQDLYDELKELRKDVKILNKEFYIFKGKAFGFIALLSVLFNTGLHFLK